METGKKRARQELETLAKYLAGDVVYEHGIQVLKIADELGDGQVRCICFDEGLIAMEFDIRLKEDITANLDWADRNMVYFLYCLQGNCFHKFQDNEKVSKLEELQTAVVSSGLHMISELLIRKEERLIFNLIRIDKERYSKKFKEDFEDFDGKIIELLDAFEANKGYFHLGKLNLGIGELIKMLENAKYVNDVSSLMHFEGICHLILAKQIEQFNHDIKHSDEPSTSLLRKELQQISELCDYITNYPELEHSITSLCTKSALSAAKLQQGFKFIHGMTVGEFIRDSRLNRAELLIRSTEMNISEVVYSIGLTSRSYFCKIFKNKYRCSPKNYKNNIGVQY